MNQAIISVGSNIKPEENIEKAAEWLGKEQKILAKSSIKKTKPVGFTNQPDFLNCAFSLETGLDAKELKGYLEDVEKRLGRQKTENKNGPRTIDLDIIVFNGVIVNNDFYKYDFVKSAVLELLPDLVTTHDDEINE
jgi:2-amino-4-hydroxy-6-hydroxymethyldihydropteridine diphosphokinase